MMSIMPKARFDLEVSPAKRSGIMDISSLKWSSFAEEEVVLLEGKKVPIWFVPLRSPPHSLLGGISGLFIFLLGAAYLGNCVCVSYYVCVCNCFWNWVCVCFSHFAKVDQKCTSPLQVGSQLDFVLSFKDPPHSHSREKKISYIF